MDTKSRLHKDLPKVSQFESLFTALCWLRATCQQPSCGLDQICFPRCRAITLRLTFEGSHDEPDLEIDVTMLKVNFFRQAPTQTSE